MLEEELYANNSPIWDVDFSQMPAHMPLPSPRSNDSSTYNEITIDIYVLGI